MNQRHANGHAVSYLSAITDCGPSATSLVISSPRIIGPGCMTMACGARRAAVLVQLISGHVVVQVDVQTGHPFLLNAQHHHNLRLRQRLIEVPLDGDSGPSSRATSGSNAGGPHRTTRAPSRGSKSALERATRECRISPTIATVIPCRRVSPGRSQGRSRARSMVLRSSRAWEGCSCMPSPAFSTGNPVACASR